MNKLLWKQSLLDTISCSDDYNLINDFKNLDPLNCLISGYRTNRLDQAIDWLVTNHPELLVNLLLVFNMNQSQHRNKQLLIDINTNAFDLINSIAGIKIILKSSGLEALIKNGQINDLSSYLNGIIIGQASHRRKNIYGKRFAKMISDWLINNSISFETELIINHKKWDFVINYGDDKKLLIEASFYHSHGSKANECGRAYLKEFQALNNPKWKGLWVVDGAGAIKIQSQILDQHFQAQSIVNFTGFQNLLKSLFNIQ